MTALLIGLLAAAGTAIAALFGGRAIHAKGVEAGRRQATEDQRARAAQVTTTLARIDTASKAREAADVAAIQAEGQAARATAGDQLGDLIAEARERGGR